LFAFAGIYRQWKGPIKKAGPNVDIEVFSFMTTLPNTLTSTINHERSPALLTSEADYHTWLTGTPDEAFGPHQCVRSPADAHCAIRLR